MFVCRLKTDWKITFYKFSLKAILSGTFHCHISSFNNEFIFIYNITMQKWDFLHVDFYFFAWNHLIRKEKNANLCFGRNHINIADFSSEFIPNAWQIPQNEILISHALTILTEIFQKYFGGEIICSQLRNTFMNIQRLINLFIACIFEWSY